MSFRRIIVSAWALMSGALLPRVMAQTIPEPLWDFIDMNCVNCHDSGLAKGKLNLEGLTFNPADPDNFRVWKRVFERVRDDEMPPAKEPRPDHVELKAFIKGLGEPLVEADRADIEANGRVRGRRLTREEYEHTLHDLLGVDIPLKALLPEDPATHGFQTVATGQQLSHYQLERYLDVADLALKEAFKRAAVEDVSYKRIFSPKELADNGRSPEARDGKSISWPFQLLFYGRMYATAAPENGWYRIRLQGVHAINPGRDGAVWGTLRSGVLTGQAPMLYMVGLVEAAEQPRDIVFEAWIEKGHSLMLRPDDFTLDLATTGGKEGNVSYIDRDIAQQGYSGIAHTGIEIERIFPHADREKLIHKLYGGIDPEEAAAEPAEHLDALVSGFAERAFRAPVSESQLAPYLGLARESLAEGHPLPKALGTAYRAILCSPRFLTFIEGPGVLEDYEIATRLSYALWVSMPDEALLDLAAKGRLRDPAVLGEQIERLLDDPKSERFLKSFTDQWLKLNEIDFTSPDPTMFPAFDAVVHESMLQETRAYVRELISEDLSVTHLVDSDFAFMNGRLARHYLGRDQRGRSPDSEQGETEERADPAPEAPLPEGLVPGHGIQKVALASDSYRGGLLTQGAILKVTADGTSTSPVVRGVFVNERLLGAHIPPPPPGVPAIEPDIRGAVTIREQLEKHRSSESCASCHYTIDPPGFVLENFDPVGNWRDFYGEAGAAVDSAGVTPDGETFTGLETWKQIYRKRGPQLARGFAEQFLTYATGATVRFSENFVIDDIVDATEASDHGLRSIIRASLMSSVFLRK